MKKKEKIQLNLAADVSQNGYTLSFYCDKESATYFVGIVKDKVKNKEDYEQIILSEGSVRELSKWLQLAEISPKPGRIYLSCVSNCEILMFEKVDNAIYVQLYQVASFPARKNRKIDDEFSMNEKNAGILGRTLQIWLHCCSLEKEQC